MTARRSYWRWWPEAASVTIVGVPFVAAILRELRGAPRLAGDLALTELAVRAVGTHAVLVGPYSRFGWNHPGPFYFHALAPWYWLFGADGRALTAGAILVNVAAVTAVLVFARRRGGPGLMLWTAIALTLFAWHLGEGSWSAWTPFVTILPAAAFMITAWSVACGDRWALPVMFVSGTFIVQTHVGYLPLTVAVGGLAIALTLLRVRRGSDDLGGWRFPIAMTLGLVVVMWIPPALDAVANDPSNFDLLLDFRDDPGEFETHSIGEGLTVATRGFGGFLNGRIDVSSDDASIADAGPASLVTLVAVTAAGALAAARRRWKTLALVSLVGAAFIASVFAVSEVVGPLFSYLVTWTSLLGLIAWIAIGAAVIPELEVSAVGRILAVAIGSGVALAAMVLAFPSSAPTAPIGSGLDDVGSLGRAISQAERTIGERRPVIVRARDWRLWPTASAVVAGLRDDGIDAYAEQGELAGVFEQRDLRSVRPDDAVVTVVRTRDECGAAQNCVLALR